MNKLFTKIAGLSLGLAMAIGVGVGLGSSKASEAKAESANVELCVSWDTTLAYATGYTHNYTISNLNGGTTTLTIAAKGVFRQSSNNTYFQMNKKTGYFKNTTKMPGKITKIETTWSAAKNPTKCFFATSAEATSGDKTVEVTASTSVTYTAPTDASYFYFNIDVSTGSGSAQMTSCKVYYETATVKLSTPANLSAVQSGSDVTLSWGAVSNASSYKVVVDNSGTYTYTGLISTSKTVTGLSQGSHSFTVQAIGNGSTYSDSEVSDSKAFTVTESKTLQSIEIGGTLSKTTYSTTEAWSHSGLTVTAHYDIGDEDVTANASWSYSPTTPTFGTAQVSITASFGGKTNSKDCAVTVNKTKLSNPNPVYASKKITWDAVTGATSYKGYFGSNSSSATPVTSPVDVSDYAGEGEQVFHLQAVGNSTYADSDYVSCNFEVPAVVKYQLVTSTDDLVAGCNYIIGNTDKNYFISTTQASNNRTAYALTGSISDNKLVYEDGMEIIALGGETGSWTLEATAGTDGALGYLYAAGANSSNYLRTKSESTTWTIEIATDGKATLISSAATRGLMRYNPNSGSPMFACYATTSTTGQAVTIWKEVSTKKTISINKTSISGFKDSEDKSLSVTCSNFTPSGINFSYADNGTKDDEHVSTSGFVSVSAGALVDKVYSLTVNLNGVGSTNVKVEVVGATVEPLYFDVTVYPVPTTITVNDGKPLEIQTGTSKQPGVIIKDSEGNKITGAEWNREIISASPVNCVTLPENTTTKIEGNIEGTATIKYTAKLNNKVFEEVFINLVVNVVDDYLESVKDVSFKSSLVANQGDSPTLDIFSTRVGNTHFGSTEDIPLDYFRFSYEDEMGVDATQFSYDFDHGTEVDATHKEQMIYVYCTLGNISVGSYTVVVEQADNPLTAITLTNEEIVDNELDLERGSSLQLTWEYTPTNPTDGKEVVFTIEDNDNDVDISVSATGLIEIGSDSNLGSVIVNIVSSHNESIYDSVIVNVCLEDMTYQVNEPESWAKASSISVGDQIVIVNETASRELTGVASSIGTATTYTTTPSFSYVLTVGEGCDDNTYTLLNGENYLAYTNTSTSKNNNLYTLSNPSTDDQMKQISWTFSFDENGNVDIINVYNTSRNLRYNKNANQERFCCYVNSQELVQVYKKTGGLNTKTVDETLFNGIHNNFGESGTTYIWNKECADFNSESWATAGAKLTSITGFANYKLNIAVANENGNEVERFLAKYDIIVAKVPTANDFLGRFAEGGINASSFIGKPAINLFNNSSSTVIIIISLVISAASIGGYFYYKKRKEN